MRSKPPKKPKSLQWQIEALGHSVIEGMAGLLSGASVFRLGEILGGLAWQLMPSRRNTTIRNLRIAFAGEKSLGEIHQLGRETFRRTGANLISAAHTARLPAEKLGHVLRLENRDLLENALAGGKGIVLLLAHMGNWELLSRIIHLFPPGTRTGAFYRPLNNPLLDQRVLRRRQVDGTRMFSKRDNPLRVAAFLREGGVVGVLADQRAGHQGQLVPFFGRLTRVSPLPSLLARRSKSTVLAMSLSCEAPGKWVATFHAVDQPQQTQQCMTALETAMKSHPIDVFWMQERWKVYVRSHRPLNQWLDVQNLRGSRPHRILCWSQPDLLEEIPEEWHHPDAIYEHVRAEQLAGKNAGQVHHWLATLEDTQPLPFDFVLCNGRAPDGLAKACKARGIPVISLSPSARP